MKFKTAMGDGLLHDVSQNAGEDGIDTPLKLSAAKSDGGLPCCYVEQVRLSEVPFGVRITESRVLSLENRTRGNDENARHPGLRRYTRLFNTKHHNTTTREISLGSVPRVFPVGLLHTSL